MSVTATAVPERLNPEKLAYWYFRLNGFLLIENFYVHPRTRGGARTDVDLLAVRFPHRAERLYDNPEDIMDDDEARLGLSRNCVDVVLAEVKSGRCALNGPWTNPGAENMHRVLSAMGCIPKDRIGSSSAEIYENGYVEDGDSLRVRLVAVGDSPSVEITERFPRVHQVCWDQVLEFIYQRFRRYRHQKRDVDHWDRTGRLLREKAVAPDMTKNAFISWARGALKLTPEGA